MKQAVIIALIKKCVEDSAYEILSTSKRGTRGLRGPTGDQGTSGRDFDLEENKDLIVSLVKENVLKLEDLTEEEVRSLVGRQGERGQRGRDFDPEKNKDIIESVVKEHSLKIDNLSEEELNALKGPEGSRGLRGHRGRDGSNFIFSEYEEEIEDIIKSEIALREEDLQLQLQGLTEDQIDIFRGRPGPRGQRGKAGKSGKDFILEEHQDYFDTLKLRFEDLSIEDKDSLKLAFEHLEESEKDSLKLKFENLTEDERLSLKGFRGQRGKAGRAGEKGDTGPRGLLGLPGTTGPMGLPGVEGAMGQTGPQGLQGAVGPFVVDVQLEKRKKEFRFVFVFNTGEEIETGWLDFPEINNYFVSGGGVAVARAPVEGVAKLIVSREATETISALKLVTSSGADFAEISEPDENYENSQVLGLAINAALTGERVSVLVSGIVTDASFTFGLNSILYLGDNGTITETQPTTGFRTVVGKCTGLNEIYINIKETIIL